MSDVLTLLKQGGPVMFPIVALSLLLYQRCGSLLWYFVSTRRWLRRADARSRGGLAWVRQWQDELSETYRQEKILIRAMVAAAPLLGLLGTVMGMIATFESLAGQAGERSMQGLAAGISQALITTEAGLAVVIPAVLMLYYAHRQLQKSVQHLAEVEATLLDSESVRP